MFSSIFFFVAAKWFLALKGLGPFVEARSRNLQKSMLLMTLVRIKSKSFTKIAVEAVAVTDTVFNTLGGERILSLRYVARLAALGGIVGFIFSLFALFFVASDLAQTARLLQKTYWWQLVVLPSVATGVILCPIDLALAHMLVRWAARGAATRSFIALGAALPLAYCLWAVGAGVSVSLGFLFRSGFFMPTFTLNRIQVAFIDPFGTSSGTLQIGDTWLSYSLLAASVALSSLCVSVTFFVSGMLKMFPSGMQSLIANPLFEVLRLLTWLERKGVNYPIGVIAWLGAALLLVLAVALRLHGA